MIHLSHNWSESCEETTDKGAVAKGTSREEGWEAPFVADISDVEGT